MPRNADQPEELAGPVLTGGRYRLLNCIGSGGMGVVWAGQDEVLRRRVAIKELRHGSGSSDRTVAEGRERTLREARAAAALNHPNIVRVYDVIEHHDRPWIVMELVSGRSLKKLVTDEGPLPADRAVGIALQLLSALCAAHDAGITHRDVKPANVLISSQDQVRLTDFGIAVLPDAETLTETGAALGTPGYLAPEQARGLPPGPAADMFGFGATLYYTLEGVGPFQREGYLPMLVAYTRHEIRPPQRAGHLGPLLLRLLNADPDKRPTAEQCRELLLGGAVRRPGLSRRLAVAGGLATAAATIGGALLRDRQQAVRAQDPTASASKPTRPIGLGAVAWHRDDMPRAVLVGPTLVSRQADGVVALDADNGRQRWRDTSQGSGEIRGIGSSMVLVEGPQGYRALAADTGAVRWRNPVPESRVFGVDGLLLVDAPAVESGSGVIAYDATTGLQRWRLNIDEYLDSSYVAGPGGVLYAPARRDDETWLYGVDTKNGKVRWRTRVATGTDHSLSLSGHGRQAHAIVLDHQGWSLTAIDAATGRPDWTVSLVKHPQGPLKGITEQDSQVTVAVPGLTALADTIVVSVTDEQLTLHHAGLIALDADTGSIRWRRPLLNPTIAAASGNRLFVGSHDSMLHELDPATGTTLWSTSTFGPASRLDVTSTMLIATIGSGASAYPLIRR